MKSLPGYWNSSYIVIRKSTITDGLVIKVSVEWDTPPDHHKTTVCFSDQMIHAPDSWMFLPLVETYRLRELRRFPNVAVTVHARSDGWYFFAWVLWVALYWINDQYYDLIQKVLDKMEYSGIDIDRCCGKRLSLSMLWDDYAKK